MYPVVLLFGLSLVVSVSPPVTDQAARGDDDSKEVVNVDPKTTTTVSPPGPTEGKLVAALQEQPTCNPLIKLLLSRLLKEHQKFDLPSDSSDVVYDAKVRLSGQAVAEIEAFLKGGDSYRTGELDNAISHLLVELEPQDDEAWKRRFEDMFGAELDTMFKEAVCVTILVVIISIQHYSTVSWFVQFGRSYALMFIVSFIYVLHSYLCVTLMLLCQIAVAKHQNNMVKMASFKEKCTGMKKIGWMDALKDWFRSTFTLQEDPCLSYYRMVLVNPILEVAPTKILSITIANIFTAPLKDTAQGMNEFVQGYLKDSPITLQIPLFLLFVLTVVVCMCGSVQAAFQHGITAPFHSRHCGPTPPPPEDQEPWTQHTEEEEEEEEEEEDWNRRPSVSQAESLWTELLPPLQMQSRLTEVLRQRTWRVSLLPAATRKVKPIQVTSRRISRSRQLVETVLPPPCNQTPNPFSLRLFTFMD
ncbi:chloride channel CLIC-like protein 1 [Genypterus blacodes]|uniref:chloride channel CLIC-like protein 1 n=1 Tax=Genypterus blacodes TaxID=154954 RepID=UPI003F75B63F